MTVVFGGATPLGEIWLEEKDGALTRLWLDEKPPQSAGPPVATPLLTKALEELREYAAGTRTDFDLPLEPGGTPFQQRIWAFLRSIPYGQTRTYTQAAQAAGNPKACRGAGGAIHRNPLAILIPCHRVVGKDGSLTGYGLGLDRKKALLELEQGRPMEQGAWEGQARNEK